jgi:hypothetical protein
MKSSQGWQLHLIGHDPETGAEIEMRGGVFPIKPTSGRRKPTQMRWRSVNCG